MAVLLIALLIAVKLLGVAYLSLEYSLFKMTLTPFIGRRLHTLPPGRKLGWRKN
jgi:hypothetical protein